MIWRTISSPRSMLIAGESDTLCRVLLARYGHCHGKDGREMLGRVTCTDATDLVCASQVLACRHPAGDMAVRPIHAELPGRRGPVGTARARPHFAYIDPLNHVQIKMCRRHRAGAI